LTQTYCSLDEKKAQAVVDEVTAAGGDAIAVGGDVAADDFPAKVLDATIKYAQLIPCPIPAFSSYAVPYFLCLLLQAVWQAEPHRQ
jgi:hypothetical protein